MSADRSSAEWGALPVDSAAQVRRLRDMTDAVRRCLSQAEEQPPDERLRRLVGLPAMVEQLARMEPDAERSVWVLQPEYFYDPEDPGVELTYAAQARGVTTLLVTRPATLSVHPLLPSIFPNARVAPVFTGAMIVDERRLMVAGDDSLAGERTAWLCTRSDLLSAVLDIWHLTMQLSTPVLEPGTQPPLSRRQLQVAQLLAVGEKDQAIARRLDMSARTVERDVSTILRTLGARSRTEAVLLMRGRGVNGGQPDR